MKLLFLIAGLFITFISSAQTGNSDVKWLLHKDSAYNVSIQYPSDWQLKPANDRSRFFIASYPETEEDKFRENLNCVVHNIEDGSTIQQAEEDIVKTLTGIMAEFKIVQSGYSKWNNADAYELEYTCTYANTDVKYDLHMLQKATIINGKLYVLTFSALNTTYDKYIGKVRKMFDSFKIQ